MQSFEVQLLLAVNVHGRGVTLMGVKRKRLTRLSNHSGSNDAEEVSSQGENGLYSVQGPTTEGRVAKRGHVLCIRGTGRL